MGLFRGTWVLSGPARVAATKPSRDVMGSLGGKLEQLEEQPAVFCTPEKEMKRKSDITFEMLSFILKSKVVRPQTSEKIP